MKINRKIRFQLFVQNWLFVVLFLLLVGMLGYLTREFHVERDVTQAARNQLTEGSANVVKKMKGAVNITSGTLDAKLKDLPKDKTIIVYCS